MPKYELEHTNNVDDQCQYCHHKRVEGSDFCARHGANKQIRRAQKENLYNFRKTAFLQRVKILSKHEERFTLTVELGIQRAILEELTNKINTDSDILRYNSQINNTTNNIRNLVNDALKLDAKIGEMISMESMIDMIQVIVDIISEEIDDTDVVSRIADRINEAIVSKYASE